jgi:hypothetical protein
MAEGKGKRISKRGGDMTNDRAKEVLKAWNLNHSDEFTVHEFDEAFRMAIKALEQQPCDDAISRDDALKALDYDIKSFEFKSGVGRHMNEIANLLNTIYEIQSDNIKALPSVQSKPIECEDAISREQAIDAVADLFEMSEYPHPYPQGKPIRLREIKEKLKQLPPVQPKPKTGHWISCSERLPEICEKDCHGNITFSKTVLTTQIYGNGFVYVGNDQYTTNNGGWLSEVPFDNPDERCKVIAWMPLPEPYKPQESEDEE